MLLSLSSCRWLGFAGFLLGQPPRGTTLQNLNPLPNPLPEMWLGIFKPWGPRWKATVRKATDNHLACQCPEKSGPPYSKTFKTPNSKDFSLVNVEPWGRPRPRIHILFSVHPSQKMRPFSGTPSRDLQNRTLQVVLPYLHQEKTWHHSVPPCKTNTSNTP